MNAGDLDPGESTSGQATDLFAGVVAHGHRHVDEVARDLIQMDALLETAIGKLTTAFLSLHDAVARQQAVLDQALQAGCSVVECSETLQRLRGEIERQVAAAVTSLQFQDMASQLTGRMAGHLGGVRQIFDTLDTHATAFAVHEPALSPLTERLALHGATLAAHAPRQVMQHGLEQGDIELF